MSPYIRTIHTDYTARIAPSSPTKCPPGLVPGPSFSVPSPYTRRPRRRPAPTPLPPLRTSCAYIKFDPFSDEHTEPTTPVLYRTPSTRLVSASPPLSPPRTTLIAPPPPPAPLSRPLLAPAPAPAHIDPNARSKLVAGILLNHVHAVGRPMRRRSSDGPREYVKSGLSSVISVET